MTNSNDRIDQMEVLLTETIQVTRSNARAIEALSAEVAANRADIAATRASVDGLVQTMAEFSIRSEARLNRLEDAVIGIEQTMAEFSIRSEARLNRLDDAVIGIERILEQLLRRNQNGNGDQPQL